MAGHTFVTCRNDEMTFFKLQIDCLSDTQMTLLFHRFFKNMKNKQQTLGEKIDYKNIFRDKKRARIILEEMFLYKMRHTGTSTLLIPLQHGISSSVSEEDKRIS